jgi:hypothetical protein
VLYVVDRRECGVAMGREDVLRTREQRYRDSRWDRMFVRRAMIESKAFADLKTPAAYQVLFRFLAKRQWEHVRRPCTREKSWVIANNGSIEFCYTEAERHGLSPKQFTKAIDELLRVGFIDITHTGYGLHKDKTLYAVSDRWEAYDTEGFEVKERPQRRQKIGFQTGNGHGRNSKAKKKATPL